MGAILTRGAVEVLLQLFGVSPSTQLNPRRLSPRANIRVRIDFNYDGGGLGKGGVASLFVDNNKVAEGRLERTVPVIFSADSTCMVGDKIGAPLSSDFEEHSNKFNGKISWVRIDTGTEETARQVSPEEWVRVHMSIQ